MTKERKHERHSPGSCDVHAAPLEMRTCPQCYGFGLEPDDPNKWWGSRDPRDLAKCLACQGTGQVRVCPQCP